MGLYCSKYSTGNPGHIIGSMWGKGEIMIWIVLLMIVFLIILLLNFLLTTIVNKKIEKDITKYSKEKGEKN